MEKAIEVILKIKEEEEGNLQACAFFTDNNPHGYMSISKFNEMLPRCEKKQLIDLEVCLEHMNNSVPFDNVPNIDVDSRSNFCVWLKARLQRSNQSLKLPGEEGIIRFIRDYQYGKITPKFTFDELFNAANLPKALSSDKEAEK